MVAPYSDGRAYVEARFFCPVAMVCRDDDLSLTDSYACVCPDCDAGVYGDAQVAGLRDYFATHLGTLGRRVATLHGRMLLPAPDCGGTGEYRADCTGCTDPAKKGYDPAAVIHDDASCEIITEGCRDTDASNYNSAANTYTWDTHRGTHQMVGTHVDTTLATQCQAQNYVGGDECTDDPCNRAENRLCGPDNPFQLGDGCTEDRQAFECGPSGATFTCFDPNKNWPGDYVCTCNYDYETSGYLEPGECGAGAIFENPDTPGDTISNYELTQLVSLEPALGDFLTRRLADASSSGRRLLSDCNATAGETLCHGDCVSFSSSASSVLLGCR